MTKQKTYILVDTVDGALRFRIVDESRGMSPLIEKPGQANRVHFNPYSIYGDDAATWTGRDKYSLSLSVFTNTSGNLVD